MSRTRLISESVNFFAIFSSGFFIITTSMMKKLVTFDIRD